MPDLHESCHVQNLRGSIIRLNLFRLEFFLYLLKKVNLTLKSKNISFSYANFVQQERSNKSRKHDSLGRAIDKQSFVKL